jgi:hypothetical protein
MTAWALNILIALAGGGIAYWAAADIRIHAGALLQHLQSGSWEVVSSRPYLEQYIRRNYEADPSAWDLTFAAGSGYSYPLDDVQRESTLKDLGQAAFADIGTMREHSTPLPSSYGHLLAQRVSEIAENVDERRDAEQLRHAANKVESNVLEGTRSPSAEGYRGAQKILSRLPKGDLLAKALKAYSDYELSRGIDFPAFQTALDPSFAVTTSVVLPQAGRCRGAVRSTGQSTDQATADISVLPRLGRFHIQRPWVSDALLNETSQSTRAGTPIGLHFSLNGDLRIIPDTLWILMPDQIEFNGVDQKDVAEITQWIANSTCCRIFCESSAFDVGPPGGVQQLVKGTFRAVRTDLPPQLYAVASHRRTARQ